MGTSINLFLEWGEAAGRMGRGFARSAAACGEEPGRLTPYSRPSSCLNRASHSRFPHRFTLPHEPVP